MYKTYWNWKSYSILQTRIRNYGNIKFSVLCETFLFKTVYVWNKMFHKIQLLKNSFYTSEMKRRCLSLDRGRVLQSNPAGFYYGTVVMNPLLYGTLFLQTSLKILQTSLKILQTSLKSNSYCKTFTVTASYVQ